MPQRIGSDFADTVRDDPFRAAFVRLETQQGLYRESPTAVTFLTPTVFRAAIPLPAAVPTGSYEIDVKLFADGNLVARTNFGARGRSRPASSNMSPTPRATMACCTALVTALMALLTGWFASVVFCARTSRPAGTLGGESIEPAFAQHMRGERERAEQIGEGRVAHIEPAGKCAESRHHHARRIGGKAAPADRAAAMRDPRDRMQMAADFAGTRRSAGDGTSARQLSAFR